MLHEFQKRIMDRIPIFLTKHNFFKYPISPSCDITERDYCMLLASILDEQNMTYSIEHRLGKHKIDLCINESGTPHYMEIKDCGIYETRYEKSLTYCANIENNSNDPIKKEDFIVPDGYERSGSKTDWFNYFNERYKNKSLLIPKADIQKEKKYKLCSEGMARDVYKLFLLYYNGLISHGDCCSCFSFTFWPQPFPQGILSSTKKGARTIEVGTGFLIEQMKIYTDMRDIAYSIETVNLPQMGVLNPFSGKMEIFEKATLKLTIEILSWMN